MTPKGCETVKNDIQWFLTMSETGDKVVRAVEYLDAAATMAIGSKIQSIKQSTAV